MLVGVLMALTPWSGSTGYNGGIVEVMLRPLLEGQFGNLKRFHGLWNNSLFYNTAYKWYLARRTVQYVTDQILLSVEGQAMLRPGSFIKDSNDIRTAVTGWLGLAVKTLRNNEKWLHDAEQAYLRVGELERQGFDLTKSEREFKFIWQAYITGDHRTALNMTTTKRLRTVDVSTPEQCSIAGIINLIEQVRRVDSESRLVFCEAASR